MSAEFIVVAIIAAGAFGYAIFRMSKATMKLGGQYIAPRYGAWQGHTLGTTDLEPGELTEIEKELRAAPKHNE